MDRQWIPTVAGVLEIVSGVFALIGALAVGFACGIINSIPDVRNDPDVPIEMLTALFTTLALVILAVGIVSFVGGFAGIRRRGWTRAMAGAIAALLIAPPAGIFALVLVIVGENEFSDRSPNPG